jgi:hypothetical protein
MRWGRALVEAVMSDSSCHPTLTQGYDHPTARTAVRNVAKTPARAFVLNYARALPGADYHPVMRRHRGPGFGSQRA